MGVLKKLLASIVLIIIVISSLLSTVSSAAGGSLNDGQRRGIVDVLVKMINDGNSKNSLRYSQGQRNDGYNWTLSSGKQSTATNVKLLPHDVAMLNEYSAQRYGRDKYGNPKHPAIPENADGSQTYACQVYGADISGKIAFDCSSLVSAAYDMAVGSGFNWTSGTFSKTTSQMKVVSKSEVKPGDTLWRQGHVAIYLGDPNGNGQELIAEAVGMMASNNMQAQLLLSANLLEHLRQNMELAHLTPSPSGSMVNQKKPVIQAPDIALRDSGAQVQIVKYNASAWTHALTYTGVVREGRAIDLTQLKDFSSESGGSSNTDGKSNSLETYKETGIYNNITIPGNSTVKWRKIVYRDDLLSNSEGYFFKGIPTYGQYVGKVTVLDWLNVGFLNVVDWVIGATTYVFKAMLIGFTSMAESTVGEVLNFGTEDVGQEKAEAENTSTWTTLYRIVRGQNKVTVEDILFNRVPLLDVNFFDFENAGGKQLSENSLIYKIREIIAAWYYTLRTIAIMAMLVVLIYLAIRMALSQVGEERANYKTKLIDWLIGFIIIIAIHYFMLVIIATNNQFVKIFDPVERANANATNTSTQTIDTSGMTDEERYQATIEGLTSSGYQDSNVPENKDKEQSIYEQVRIQAHDIQAITGWATTIIYMVLVYYLIRFVIFYIGRVFTLAVLTVISPIMGVLYAMNKKQYPLKSWGLEYGHNVLIQLVHALAYSTLVSTALALTKSSTFRGAIIAAVCLGFIFTAEHLIRRIFGFESSRSLSDLSSSTLASVGAYAVGRRIFGEGVNLTKRGIRTTTRNMNNSENNRRINNDTNNFKLDNVLNGTPQNSNQSSSRTGATNAGTPNVGGTSGMPNPANTNTIIMPEAYNTNGKRQYVTVSNIEEQVEAKKQEERRARKDFILQGIEDPANIILGAGTFMASIPVIVINPEAGALLSIWGIKQLHRALGRREKKIKKPKKVQKQRFKGKKLRFGYSKTMALATGGGSFILGRVLDNAKESKENIYALVDELAILKEARGLEDELVRAFAETADLQNMDFNRIQNDMYNENMFETTVQEIDKKNFKRALEVGLQNVTRQDIREVVTEFTTENKKTVEIKDIEEIAEKINEKMKDEGKEVRVTTDFTDSVREDLKRKIKKEEHIVTQEDLDKEKKVNRSTQKGQDGDSLRREYNREDSKEEQANRSTQKGQDGDSLREEYNREDSKEEQANRSTQKGQDGDSLREEYNRENSNEQNVEMGDPIRSKEEKSIGSVLNALKEKAKLHIKEIREIDTRKIVTEKELNEKVEKRLKQMNNEEIINLMTESLQNARSVEKPIESKKYEPIMEIVRKIDAVNSDYMEVNERKTNL